MKAWISSLGLGLAWSVMLRPAEVWVGDFETER